MVIRRIIILFLSALVLLPVFLSCSEPADTAAETTSGSTGTAAETTELHYAAEYLPGSDFGGYKFRIVTVEKDVYSLTLAADAAEENGEVINDAVYKRNRVIEDRYNMKFREIDVAAYDALTSNFKKSVTSASDDFDLNLMICRDAFSTALEGMVLSVLDLPYVDLSQPWYAQDVNNALSIGNKFFFAYSDECLNMFEQSLCIVYNKQLVEDYNYEDIYKTVYDGKWTVDAFFTLAQGAVTDLNGDGKMTDTDLFGVVSEGDMFYPSFWVGSDFKTIMKDADDLPYFNGLGNPKFDDILDKVYNYVWGGGKIYFEAFKDKFENFPNTGGEDLRRAASSLFAAGNALFKVTIIGHLSLLRDMKSDFGVVPIPKYDDAQEKYVTRVIDGWINCVPVTCPDLERTSVIVESLAVESKNHTVPAYYDVALKYKYSRDEDTVYMLDVIYNSRTMDLGDTVWMVPVRVIYTDLFMAGKNTFASATEKKLKTVQSTIDKAVEAFRAME